VINQRYHELDSLRGLASISVVLSHFVLSLPHIFLTDQLRNTPLHIFWAGHEAVILFFILSGFVLSLPYYGKKTPNYVSYMIKRICRIYIPYALSIFLAILCMNMFSRGGIPELSKFISEAWSTPVTSKVLIDHFIMLTDFPSNYALNNVIWSLVHEMRISLIFPLLMYFIVRFSWKKNIILGASFSLTYFIFWAVYIRLYDINLTASGTSYFWTLHYIGFFVLGALIAKHRELIFTLFKGFSSNVKFIVLVIGILLYTYPFWFFPNIYYFHLSFISDWVTAIGASVFIIAGVNSTRISKFLHLKPVHFIGKISYSLYLFHMIVLLTLVNIFYGQLQTSLILGLVFISSIVIAAIMYYLIEEPSIKLGKVLTMPKAGIHSSSKTRTELQQDGL
jgi:peptidoglycan/LPS O-acetylase OafA/YrhL